MAVHLAVVRRLEGSEILHTWPPRCDVIAFDEVIVDRPEAWMLLHPGLEECVECFPVHWLCPDCGQACRCSREFLTRDLSHQRCGVPA